MAVNKSQLTPLGLHTLVTKIIESIGLTILLNP